MLGQGKIHTCPDIQKSMDLGCMAQHAFQRNWFPDPIAGLFSYQSWNGMDGFWQVARLFNLDAFKPIEGVHSTQQAFSTLEF